MATPDAGVQLTTLKEMTSSYAQGNFVEDGGWAIMPGSSSDDRKAAALCSQELAEREMPTVGKAAQISDGATVAQ